MKNARNITPAFYLDCLKAVVEHQRASKNFIQKHMRCSFEKADAVVWAFEKAGYVSPEKGNGRRDVIADDWAVTELEEDIKRDQARAVVLKDEEPAQPVLKPYTPPPAYRRQVKWSPEVEDQIIDQVIAGYTVEKICEAPTMASKATVMRWLNGECGVKDGASFKARYDQARIARADRLAAEIIRIGDDSSQDRIVEELPGGVVTERVDHEHIARSKLRCDNRRWVLQTLFPERFAAKMIVEHQNGGAATSGNPQWRPPLEDLAKLSRAARGKLRAFLEQVQADEAGA